MSPKIKTIEKEILLNAPKEKVWDVLQNDKYTRIWHGEFSEGAHAETDWKVGSRAKFTDKTGDGLLGKIVANTPYKILSIEYEGMIMNGVESFDSKEVMDIKGGRETYVLSEKNKSTSLSVSCDMAIEYFEMMSEAWDRALQKIKELSEAK